MLGPRSGRWRSGRGGWRDTLAHGPSQYKSDPAPAAERRMKPGQRPSVSPLVYLSGLLPGLSPGRGWQRRPGSAAAWVAEQGPLLGQGSWHCGGGGHGAGSWGPSGPGHCFLESQVRRGTGSCLPAAHPSGRPGPVSRPPRPHRSRDGGVERAVRAAWGASRRTPPPTSSGSSRQPLSPVSASGPPGGLAGGFDETEPVRSS